MALYSFLVTSQNCYILGMTPTFWHWCKRGSRSLCFWSQKVLTKHMERRKHCALVSSSCLRRLALSPCRNACKGEDHKDFDLIWKAFIPCEWVQIPSNLFSMCNNTEFTHGCNAKLFCNVIMSSLKHQCVIPEQGEKKHVYFVCAFVLERFTGPCICHSVV